MAEHQLIYQNIESAKNFLAFYDKKSDFFKVVYDLALHLIDKEENYREEEINAIMLIDDAIQETLNKKELTLVVSAGSTSAKLGLGEHDKQLFSFFDAFSKIYSAMLIQTMRNHSKEMLLQVAARTLYNLNRLVKWTLYDYSRLSETIWQCMNLSYLLTEQKGVVTHAVRPYTQLPETTLQDLFIRGHMLSLSQTGYFNIQEINFIYTILEKYSNRIQIYTEPIDSVCFICAINSNKPAHLFRKEKITEHSRFWTMDVMTRLLNQWRVSNLIGEEIIGLDKQNALPDNPIFINKLLAIWTKTDIGIESKTYLDQPIELICTSDFNQIKGTFFSDKTSSKNKFSYLDTLSLEVTDSGASAAETNVPVQLTPGPFPAQMMSISSSSIDVVYDLTGRTALNLYSLILWQPPAGSAVQGGIGFLNRLQRGEGEQIKANIIMLGLKPTLATVLPAQDSDKQHLWAKKAPVLLCKTSNKKTQKYSIISNYQPSKTSDSWAIKLKNRIFSFKTKEVTYLGNGWCCIDIDILAEVVQKTKKS